ncbi:MAG: hypothetical protein AB7J35_21725 [Dehalococcoidia bacterium]
MLEDPSLHSLSRNTPRASLVLAAGELGNTDTEIWMGGAHTPHGDELAETHLATSWLIDCAGDIDRSYRDVTSRWLACVFPDIDGRPAAELLIQSVVREATTAITSGNGAAPERIYVMCQHGMNRSGLVSGLILRSLGLDPESAIQRIRNARPGALANDGFVTMLRHP